MGHVRDQHRAYFNLDFLHAAFFLDVEGLRKTKEFIESLAQNLVEDDTGAKNAETDEEYVDENGLSDEIAVHNDDKIVVKNLVPEI